MILAVFTIDTKHTAKFPNEKVPFGLGGHVVAIILDLVERESDGPYPWNESLKL